MKLLLKALNIIDYNSKYWNATVATWHRGKSEHILFYYCLLSSYLKTEGWWNSHWNKNSN
jgi:hypothetical protein